MTAQSSKEPNKHYLLVQMAICLDKHQPPPTNLSSYAGPLLNQYNTHSKATTLVIVEGITTRCMVHAKQVYNMLLGQWTWLEMCRQQNFVDPHTAFQ